ncbi:hypothetical protein DL767_005224 [Monosporascus sp. MG133]|nr:hypothetical protein DL767_005224 [Monosporascus sp. MG133]
MDLFAGPMPYEQLSIATAHFPVSSDISSGSELVSSPQASMHTRSTSIMSNTDDARVPQFEAVIAAEAAWPLARCNPPIYSGTCPRTAIIHLEALEQKSRHEGTWSALEKHLQQVDRDAADFPSVVPIYPRTRDQLLVIAQTFLQKALEIHRGGVNGRNKGQLSPPQPRFVVLPPSHILEYLLRSYIRNLSFFYSLVSTGCVDPNEMVSRGCADSTETIQNNIASTLLVLLMIAQGASAVPTAEARALSAGLIETCRISLFDIIEKDIEMCADPIILRCALLFTLLGAWSGDKWLMDIAMGQRGMYLSMLKHAGMFEFQSPTIPPFNSSTNVELQWRSWLHREAQNRLVYNWVMVDQELSLFHDTAPMLSVSELLAPLPGPESLWTLTTSENWLAAVQSMSAAAGTPTKESTTLRLNEVRALLQKWYQFSIACPSCHINKTNLVLYHLISLNAITNFPEIERLARREGFDGSHWELSLRHKRCIHNREESVFHCGQVFRLLRSMTSDRRPSWWSAALYRATLILFTDSISRRDPTFQKRENTGNTVAVDQLMPEDPVLVAYTWKFEGVPVLTGSDGSATVSLEEPNELLGYAIKTLEEGVSLRLVDGIKRKLIALGTNWNISEFPAAHV